MIVSNLVERHSLSYWGGDNAGSALIGGVTVGWGGVGGAGASTPRPLRLVCLAVCPVPAVEEAPPPGSQQPAASLLLSPARCSARLCSVLVASLGVGASCLTTKVQSLCSRRRDGYTLWPLTEGEIY